MNVRKEFDAWCERQSTNQLASLAVVGARRGISTYYAFRDPEEYMQDLFSNSEYSDALSLAEHHLLVGDGSSFESLVTAIASLRESIDFLERNIEESSGGADVVGKRTRALLSCKGVLHAVIALVWPRGSEEEVSESFDADERAARTENGGRFHSRIALEYAAKALEVELIPFLFSCGVSDLQQ